MPAFASKDQARVRTVSRRPRYVADPGTRVISRRNLASFCTTYILPKSQMYIYFQNFLRKIYSKSLHNSVFLQLLFFSSCILVHSARRPRLVLLFFVNLRIITFIKKTFKSI